MAFAKHQYNPVSHRGWNLITVHLTSLWDEQAAKEYGYFPGDLGPLQFTEIEDALQVANRINARAYEIEYDWRQSLRSRREAPVGLKVASNARDPRFQAVYVILGQDVYFTGVGEGKNSTVNRAEEFIEAICDDALLDFRLFTFYSIQPRNYGERQSFEVDRLIFDEENQHLHVAHWHPIACSPFDDPYSEIRNLPGLLPEVLEVFYDFLYFQEDKIEYQPEWFGIRLPLEEVLEEWDRRSGTVAENATKKNVPPADILYDRILDATGEGSGYISDEAVWEIFRVVSAAFPIIAYWRFSEMKRQGFLRRYSERMEETRGKDEIVLTEEQAAVLARIAAKAGVVFDPNQREISLSGIEEEIQNRSDED